jgi:hypothetical protein
LSLAEEIRLQAIAGNLISFAHPHSHFALK